MADRLSRARAELRRAARQADADVGERLQSIEEELTAVLEADPANGEAHPDRLAELEETLVALGDRTEGEVHRHVATAEALIYGYRTDLPEN